jgi:hypothetical protein
VVLSRGFDVSTQQGEPCNTGKGIVETRETGTNPEAARRASVRL